MVTKRPAVDTSISSQPSTANANPPYPTTPPSASALQSAKTTASKNSIYSPDLTRSPAFDLIDMSEARQRARDDSDNDSHGTWDTDDEHEDTPEEAVDVPKPLRTSPSKQNMQEPKNEIPSILKPGPAESVRPRRSVEIQRYDDDAQANPWAESAQPERQQPSRKESNNPYRQPHGLVGENSQAAWDESRHPLQPPMNAPPAPPVELPTMRTPADEISQLSLRDQDEFEAFETAEVLPVPQQGRPPLASIMHQDQADGSQGISTNPWRQGSPSQQESESIHAPPGPPPKAPIQYPPQQQQWQLPSGPPSLHIGQLIDHTELAPLSQPANEGPPIQASPPNPAHSQPTPLPPISTLQPTPAASADFVPDTPTTQARGQRNEHYQIKHVRWYDASYSSDPRFKDAMRTSPILTQNANGPCPLLALVNALVLSTPQNLETALIETLRTREQVSLGLLLDAVFDELMSGRRGDTAYALPDVSELYSFLLALHTGMNVNPRFVTPASAPRGSLDGHPPDMNGVHPAERSQSKAGCFEETREMRLYSTFNIPLIHGWTAPKDTPAYGAFERCAQTFEDAQNIQFAEVELEDKLRSEPLSADEHQLLQDIKTIKSFLGSWPTQLTDFGLENISRSLKPGHIAILFRNDHFSTIYKEPGHGALMTLVTDAGYSSHDEIVWESLVDVNGAASEMFSGDFRVVSHDQDSRLNQGNSAGGEDGWTTVQSRSRYHGQRVRPNEGALRVTNGARNDGHEMPPALPGPRPNSRQDVSPLPQMGDAALEVSAEVQRTASEQEDHDLALALQLQEEEEDQQRQADVRRRREQELSEQFLSSESSPEGPRPPIPPRRSNRPAATPPTGGRAPVNRPVNGPSDPEAPPSYEQSASDRPYRPAGATAPASLSQGNPLSAYDALRRQHSAYAAQSTSTVNSMGTGPPGHNRRQSQGNRVQRRSSQMAGPPGGYPGGSPASPIQAGPSNGPPIVGQAAGIKDAEDKCVVM